MKKDEVMDQLDHPFFFLAFGVTPFVIGFGALLLYLAMRMGWMGLDSTVRK